MEVSEPTLLGELGSERGWREKLARGSVHLLWGSVLLIEVVLALGDPSLFNVMTATAFLLLFISVHAQILLLRWVVNRRWRRLMARLHGATYLSELRNLPNRNYLLSEVRREMAAARWSGTPFVLAEIAFETLDEVRDRRGDEFCDRGLFGLTEVLRRITRHPDFLAHSGGARFCVILTDRDAEQARFFLRTVPGAIPVSDGHAMFDVPVTLRTFEYDMESLYATDVLRELEESDALQRREEEHFGSEAA